MKSYDKRIKHELFIGAVIGEVTVTNFTHSEEKNKRFEYYYQYQCNCGENGVAAKSSLLNSRRKQIKSGVPTYCCSKCQKHKLSERNKIHSVRYTDPEDAHVATVFSNYKSRAKKKRMSMDLDFEIFKSLVKMDCHFCGQKPSNIREDMSKKRKGLSRGKLYGLDRIDSNLGYNKDNVLPCCEDCNKAKRNLPIGAFLNMIKNIYENLKLSQYEEKI